MSQIVLPYEKEIINQLNGNPEEFYYRYSYEWLKSSLDEKRLKARVGEMYKTIPLDIKEYYRAQGYHAAILSMLHFSTGEKKKISCDLSDVLTQEISNELKNIIQSVVHKYL